MLHNIFAGIAGIFVAIAGFFHAPPAPEPAAVILGATSTEAALTASTTVSASSSEMSLCNGQYWNKCPEGQLLVCPTDKTDAYCSTPKTPKTKTTTTVQTQSSPSVDTTAQQKAAQAAANLAAQQKAAQDAANLVAQQAAQAAANLAAQQQAAKKAVLVSFTSQLLTIYENFNTNGPNVFLAGLRDEYNHNYDQALIKIQTALATCKSTQENAKNLRTSFTNLPFEYTNASLSMERAGYHLCQAGVQHALEDEEAVQENLKDIDTYINSVYAFFKSFK